MTRPAFLDNLKSQREEMKAAIAAGKHIVYGYLRAKDDNVAKAGTLYYVGIASNVSRAFSKDHTVEVPADQSLIRLLAAFATREEAETHEIALIARFGRIRSKKETGSGINSKKLLLNISSGGGLGAFGVERTQEEKQILSELAKARAVEAAKLEACRFGFEFDHWQSLTATEKVRVRSRYERGIRGSQDLLTENRYDGNRVKQLAQAEAIGIAPSAYFSLSFQQRSVLNRRFAKNKTNLEDLLSPVDPQMQRTAARLGIDPMVWVSLSSKERHTLDTRFARGVRGQELFTGRAVDPRSIAAADKYKIDVDLFLGMDKKQRGALSQRYARGKRGAELLQGIAA